MTTLPADCFVPVPIRWRHVLAGDVFVDRNGQLWHVVAANPHRTGLITVAAERGDESLTQQLDPDDVIHVLIPVPERDAVELTRERLGARLVERRATAPPENARCP